MYRTLKNTSETLKIFSSFIKGSISCACTTFLLLFRGTEKLMEIQLCYITSFKTWQLALTYNVIPSPTLTDVIVKLLRYYTIEICIESLITDILYFITWETSLLMCAHVKSSGSKYAVGNRSLTRIS